MKIVFMGTPEFALPALQRLIDSRHEVALVVTQPDKPKGRGRRLEAPPVKHLAEQHGLAVFQPARLREAGVVERIRAVEADLGVVAAFRMLPADILTAPRLGCINIHPSLLPNYRGAAPIQRCLMDGADTTGVTLMMLRPEMDAGDLVAQQTVEIFPDDDARSLGATCAVLGAEMLMRALDDAERTGGFETEPQNDDDATFAPPIDKDDGLIPWGDPTERIMCRLRALTPRPGVYTHLNGDERLIVIQAEPLWSNEAEALGDEMNRAEPGTTTSIQKGFGFTVRTGDGHLLVTRVRPQGRREMDAAAFVNGRGIAVGDHLGDSGQA